MHDAKRIDLLIRGLAVATACSILVTIRIWTSARFFPTIPLFPSFPAIPFLWELFMVTVMLLSLVAVLFLKRPNAAIIVFLVYFAIAVIADQTRLQPWFYQFAFMFVAVLSFPKRVGGTPGEREALDACRLILAATFFWSGLQKVNVRFFTDVVPWLMQPAAPALGAAAGPVGMIFGLLLPLAEMAVGLGLVTARFRRPALVGAVLVSTSILLNFSLLSPYVNTAILSWNLAMVFFCAVLFHDARSPLLPPWQKGVGLRYRVIALLFAVMPIFSLTGHWDSFLSAALYSGNISTASIKMSEETKAELSPVVAQFVRKDAQGTDTLSLSLWSVVEINVTPYPEPRVYKGIARSFCRSMGDPAGMTLVLSERPSAFSGRQQVSRHDCSDLSPEKR